MRRRQHWKWWRWTWQYRHDSRNLCDHCHWHIRFGKRDGWRRRFDSTIAEYRSFSALLRKPKQWRTAPLNCRAARHLDALPIDRAICLSESSDADSPLSSSSGSESSRNYRCTTSAIDVHTSNEKRACDYEYRDNSRVVASRKLRPEAGW